MRVEPMTQKALRPVRVEIPKSDDPPTGTVLLVGVVAFAIGMAWPRFAGIQLGPSAPSTGGSSPPGSAVEPLETAKLSAPAKADPVSGPKLADPSVVPAAPTAVSEAIEPVVNVKRGAILSCRGGAGEHKGKECGDLSGFDEIAIPKIRGLAKCPQARGLSGKLSVLLDVDFVGEKTSVRFGKSSTVGNEFSLGHCLRIALETAKLGKVRHAHDRYSIAYNAFFEDPAVSPSGALPASSPSVVDKVVSTPAKDAVDKTRGRVEWEVAIVRDAPKTGAIVARLPKGSLIRVGPSKEGWISIGYGDGFAQSGWVYRGALAQ